MGVESSGYGPRLSSLVGLLGSVYHPSHGKVQGLLDQVLGIEASTGAINSIRRPGPIRSYPEASA